MKILLESKKLWMKLNLRGSILLSLSLQVFLIFFAPIRKRCSNRGLVLLTWSAYLVADWVADYACGVIGKAQENIVMPRHDCGRPATHPFSDLLAFWAPFLLLHLGGPDSITAFSLEDNELWLRHLLNFLFQLSIAGYVFYQSLSTSKLVVPTFLVFVAGIVKYIERTRALHLGSSGKFRSTLLTSPDAGSKYAKFVEEYCSKEQASGPESTEDTMPARDSELRVTSGNDEVNTLDDAAVIKAAYFFFTIFKGLLVDLRFRSRERNQSRKFFSARTSKDAFRVVEAELNFFYDILYTKIAVLHRPVGCAFRAISLCSISIAFALFYFLNKKYNFHEGDVRITYILILGAIALEIVAILMHICSDWTIANVGTWKKHRKLTYIIRIFIEFVIKFRYGSSLFSLPILRYRWSNSVRQCNLVDSCLRKQPKWMDIFLSLIPVEGLSDGLMYRRAERFNEKLGELIFVVLKRKSLEANDPESVRRMCSSQGEWVLKKRPDCEKLLQILQHVDYDKQILLWHIATDLWYSTDESANPNRENSKVLADYMLYLLIKQPSTMMPAVAGISVVRYRATRAQMVTFLGATNTTPVDAREVLLSARELPESAGEAEDTSHSVLSDARHLANELRVYGERKWEIICEVWVELLAFAASHCRPSSHAQQLSRGGELLTLVWLLQVNLGLSFQFEMEDH